MKKTKRNLLISLLVMVLCFSAAIASGAKTLSAKDLILSELNKLNSERIDKDFYNKSSGNLTYQIKKLDGSLIKDLQILNGSTIQCDYKLDIPNKKALANTEIDLNGTTYKSHIYIDNGQVIISKEFLSIFKELSDNDEIKNLDQYPDYVYLTKEIFIDMWDSLIKYENPQELPQYELLAFFLEAVPDKYFDTSLNKITFALDQEGLEDVIFSLMEKIQNEKERFADITVNMMMMSDSQAIEDPAKMKKEIITSIEESIANGDIPTREQIKAMRLFVKLEKLYYEVSLVPGLERKFEAVLTLQPASGYSGQVQISTDNTLTKELANSDLDITANVQKLTTKELILNLELTGESTAKVDPDLVIETPELNDQNSMDITDQKNIFNISKE